MAYSSYSSYSSYYSSSKFRDRVKRAPTNSLIGLFASFPIINLPIACKLSAYSRQLRSYTTGEINTLLKEP